MSAVSSSIARGILPDWSRQGLSLALGIAASSLIFTALARIQGSGVVDEPPPVEDLREIALPVEAPPPPSRTEELPTVVASNLIVVEGGRSDSVVKLPSLPTVSETVPRVLGVPRIDFSVTELEPAPLNAEMDNRRVFERYDVDQPCMPLVKVRPHVKRFMFTWAQGLRITYLFIVNTDGSVEGLRLVRSSGSVTIDKACAEAIANWKFAPAVRRGRSVRQWVQQTFVFKLDGGNPFESG